jgi:hypothetical protein
MAPTTEITKAQRRAWREILRGINQPQSIAENMEIILDRKHARRLRFQVREGIVQIFQALERIAELDLLDFLFTTDNRIRDSRARDDGEAERAYGLGLGIADRLDIPVAHGSPADLRRMGWEPRSTWVGFLVPSTKPYGPVIILRPRLRTAVQAATLLHELAHAVQINSAHGYLNRSPTPRHEIVADLAALLMINLLGVRSMRPRWLAHMLIELSKLGPRADTSVASEAEQVFWRLHEELKPVVQLCLDRAGAE